MSNALSTAGKNIALDAWSASAAFASLHSVWPGDTGLNEIAGGAPPYARQPITWNPAAGGNKDNDANPSFDVPAATTIVWLGFWTLVAGGVFLGSVPLGGGTPVPFQATGADDFLRADAHPFTNGQQLVVWDTEGAVLPTGLVEGTLYFVRDVAADLLKLAATSGGPAIDITDGGGFLQSVVPEAFGGQGTYTTSDVDIAALR